MTEHTISSSDTARKIISDDMRNLDRSHFVKLAEDYLGGVTVRLRLVKEIEGLYRDLRVLGAIVGDDAAPTVDALIDAFGRGLRESRKRREP